MSARQSRRTDSDRLPPHSLDAEEGVLGCILMESKTCMPEALAALKTHLAFYDLRNQAVFAHLTDMFNHNRPIDALTFAARLTVGDRWEECGGRAHVFGLPDNVPSAVNLGYYLQIVREKYLLRKYIQTCTQLAARMMDFDGEAAEVMDAAEREFLAISRDRTSSKDTEWRGVIGAAIDAMENYHRGGAQMEGLSTGFDYLDKMLCGLKPAEMIVLAGRPSTGKTSLAFNIVQHVTVECGLPAGVFSLEMSGEQLGKRSLFQYARADFQRFRTGYLKNEDIPRLVSAAAKLAAAPVKLDESSDVSIMDIRSKARRWVSEDGIRLLVVDYAGLVRGTRNYRERREEMGEVSRGVKQIAKELKIPVLLLAQLNRDIEKSENKYRVPQLSDLRDSGDFEQDAHVVAILHRPKLTAEEQDVSDEKRDWAAHSTRINLQICKQRDGPTGKVELLFEKACMRFSSYRRTKQQHEQEEM